MTVSGRDRLSALVRACTHKGVKTPRIPDVEPTGIGAPTAARTRGLLLTEIEMLGSLSGWSRSAEVDTELVHIGGFENPQVNGLIVHGFVHETRRDGLRRGETPKVDVDPRHASAEVSTAIRDRARQQRRPSYCS
jgi:hypothetical protein